MRKKLLVALAIVLALTAVLIVVVLQTNYLQDRMRLKIVSALEDSTGGRVELHSFAFDWRTLTGRLDGLVIHGVEESGEPPLLAVRSLAIQLQIISLLERNVRIVSLTADRPEINLMFWPDGSSNLPSSGRSPDWLQKTLDLRIARFEAHHGSIEINQRRHRFDLAGHGLHLAALYDRLQNAYRLNLVAQHASLDADCCEAIAGSLSSEALLRKDALDVRSFSWTQNRSTLNLQGTVNHFAQPVATFHFEASLDGQDLKRELPPERFDAGTITAEGTGRFDLPNGLSFKGRVSAQHLPYEARASSGIEYRKDELRFAELTVEGFGGTFRGSGTLSHARAFTLDGNLAQVRLNQVLAAAHRPMLPWDVRLSGPLLLAGALPESYKELAFRADLSLASFGEVRVSKKQRGELEFGDSFIRLPASRLALQGSWNAGIKLEMASSNPRELEPALRVLPAQAQEVLRSAGRIQFTGTATGSLTQPQLTGSLAIDHLQLAGEAWDQLRAAGAINAQSLRLASATLDGNSARVSLSGSATLLKWQPGELNLQAAFHHVSLRAPAANGIASGNLHITGTLANPSASGRLALDNAVLERQEISSVEANLNLANHRLELSDGKLSGPRGGSASFSGRITRIDDWRNSEVSLNVRANGYPTSGIDFLNERYPDLRGQLDVEAAVTVHLREHGLSPELADGSVRLRNATFRNTPLGQITARFSTAAGSMRILLNSNLQQSSLAGEATVSLTSGSPVQGNLRFDRTRLGLLLSLLAPERNRRLQVDGSLSGEATISGSLENLNGLAANITLNQLAVTSLASPGQQTFLPLQNSGPILLKTANGRIEIDRFHLAGRDTKLTLAGSVHYGQPRALALTVEGDANLQLVRLFDPNLISNGHAAMNATLNGPIEAPIIKGQMQIRDASLALEDYPSTALTQVNGAVIFDNGRATVDHLAGLVGGGQARLGGFVSFAGGALTYHLTAQTENVRVRSASNISITASSNLRFTGTNESSLLAGTATISRVVFNPTTDVANVLASFGAATLVPANQKSFLTGLHLDVNIKSAPALQLNTALSRDVEAEIDLRLRGTPDRPVLLGSVSANEGDIRIFGSRYSINRGEVRFVNASKIDPVLDLDLETQARGIQVDITIAGTLNQLNVTYRSDPPLQPRDIIALLTVGRTPQEAANMQTTQIVNNSPALASNTNTVLGQVVAQPPNRLSKLFGITNIKIDPLVQGISNTPQARLTLEQQVSRAITVTYVTNLSQTSEQIFRLEWALNPQFSVVAVRDDNGEFGIDFQYKKRFK